MHVAGVLKAGGAYLPMDPNYPEQRLAYMAKDAEAPVLLTHQGLRRRLPHNNLSTQVSHDNTTAEQVSCFGTGAILQHAGCSIPGNAIDDWIMASEGM